MQEAVNLGNDPFLTHTQVAKEQSTMAMPRPRSRQRLGGEAPPPIWDVAFVPAFIFLCVGATFAYGLFLTPLIPWLVFGLCILVVLRAGQPPVRKARSLESYYETQGPRPEPPSPSMAPRSMGLAAVFFGLFAGIYVYESYAYLAMMIEMGPWYHDVLASNPAAAYSDAGALRFSDSSVVDTSRAVGYRRLTTYCVAPVLSFSPPSTKAGFWVVGTDCCGPRGTFWCGDAGDIAARYAVKEPPRGWLFSHERDGYEAAIKQAEAVFGITSDHERVLVRWVEDPGQTRRLAYLHAAAILLGAAALFFGVGLLLHVVLALRAGKGP